MQRASVRLTQDEGRDATNEIRKPMIENRNPNNRENFSNWVLNGDAPSFVPRVNFALSSTARANTETHARTHFEEELIQLTYVLESSRLNDSDRARNADERTHTHRNRLPIVNDEHRDEQKRDFDLRRLRTRHIHHHFL